MTHSEVDRLVGGSVDGSVDTRVVAEPFAGLPFAAQPFGPVPEAVEPAAAEPLGTVPAAAEHFAAKHFAAVPAAAVGIAHPAASQAIDDAASDERGAGHSPATVLDVAAAIDLIALGLGAGGPMTQTLDAVAQVSGEGVRVTLSRVSAAMRWGVDPVAAWADQPQPWDRAAAAITLAVETGLPPSALLHQAADQIRRDEGARLDAAAARLGVALVIPLGLCFLPAFVLLAVVPVLVGLSSDLIGGFT